MAKIVFTLKINVKNILDLIKCIFGLNNLNIREVAGLVDRFTKIKLMPYTSIRVPFSLGRTIRGLAFLGSNDKDAFSSFVNLCSQDKQDDELINYFLSFCKEESCKTAAEIVGLPNNSILSKYPAWALVLPWEKITLEFKYREYFKAFVENRSAHTAKFSKSQLLSINNTFYSKSNARSQVLQTKALLKSIKLKGLLDLKPLPGIYIMYDARRWCWFMSGDGNHRSYIANLLGCDSFYVEIKGVIKRQDAKNWNNVRNGTYSLSEALILFDSFFNGDEKRRGFV
jgi:hypothetical protein